MTHYAKRKVCDESERCPVGFELPVLAARICPIGGKGIEMSVRIFLRYRGLIAIKLPA